MFTLCFIITYSHPVCFTTIYWVSLERIQEHPPTHPIYGMLSCLFLPDPTDTPDLMFHESCLPIISRNETQTTSSCQSSQCKKIKISRKRSPPMVRRQACRPAMHVDCLQLTLFHLLDRNLLEKRVLRQVDSCGQPPSLSHSQRYTKDHTHVSGVPQSHDCWSRHLLHCHVCSWSVHQLFRRCRRRYPLDSHGISCC